MRYRTMLEYFGFYAPDPEAPELEPAQREAEVARAARLGERSRYKCGGEAARAREPRPSRWPAHG